MICPKCGREQLMPVTRKPLATKLFIAIVLIFGHWGTCLSWPGKVVGVSDGDTITVLTEDKREIKVRLYGVDCPEKNQDFGTKAKQFTSEKVFGKTVEIDPVTMDRHGRTVGMVAVNGSNLSKMLIESGMAWVYHDYCKMAECREWNGSQEANMAQKRGIWSAKNATPPWEFRHSEREVQAESREPASSSRSPRAIHSSSPPAPSFSSSGSTISRESSSSGQTWVKPYTRKDGTQVQGHMRAK